MTIKEIKATLRTQFLGEYDDVRQAKDEAVILIEKLEAIQHVVEDWCNDSSDYECERLDGDVYMDRIEDILTDE